MAFLFPLLLCLTRLVVGHRTILAVPTIDSISWENFRYRPVYQAGKLYRGIFEWGFLYKESEIQQREKSRHQYASEPYW